MYALSVFLAIAISSLLTIPAVRIAGFPIGVSGVVLATAILSVKLGHVLLSLGYSIADQFGGKTFDSKYIAVSAFAAFLVAMLEVIVLRWSKRHVCKKELLSGSVATEM